MIKIYKNRQEAGKILAEELRNQKVTQALILGIPRGGVIVASVVADYLNFPLDIIIPRKIGSPYNPEIAIGSVTQDGTVLLNDNMIQTYGITEDEIRMLVEKTVLDIKRRMKEYRGYDTPYRVNGKIKNVILVDDGIATGFTIRAAIRSIKKIYNHCELILAAPVMPADVVVALEMEVDKIICPLIPDIFYAVGQFYQDFEQVSDDEVIKILHKFQHYEEK